ncbi:hypothetical protein [Nocardiopsis baichengensis]|uniref:hypothetical protein n=1 Tax=Nocardiopsis baichengensis TaxID=280240 RepID=UPI0003640920|nr:hypothetical protein [Nocardiopsis baichengensis]
MSPAYPPDWERSWKDIRRRARQAYTAAQSRVRFAAIKAARIFVTGGGALTVEAERTGSRTLHVGADDEGGGSRLWLGRPKDGSAVLDLREQEGETGQWALRDQEGNAVVAEGPTGVGLARPVMPVVTHWVDGLVQTWPATESRSWEPILAAWAIFQHTVVTFYFQAAALTGDCQIRLRMDGDTIGTRTIKARVPAETVTERFVVDGRPFLNREGPVPVVLEGRVVGENAGLYAIHFYNEGAGSVPEAEPPA